MGCDDNVKAFIAEVLCVVLDKIRVVQIRV